MLLRYTCLTDTIRWCAVSALWYNDSVSYGELFSSFSRHVQDLVMFRSTISHSGIRLRWYCTAHGQCVHIPAFHINIPIHTDRASQLGLLDSPLVSAGPSWSRDFVSKSFYSTSAIFIDICLSQVNALVAGVTSRPSSSQSGRNYEGSLDNFPAISYWTMGRTQRPYTISQKCYLDQWHQISRVSSTQTRETQSLV